MCFNLKLYCLKKKNVCFAQNNDNNDTIKPNVQKLDLQHWTGRAVKKRGQGKKTIYDSITKENEIIKV